jgi:hydroxymethylpyrimidine pyrophosphatase-like HAD family hydrolase
MAKHFPSLLDKFNQVDLHGKSVLVCENGEYISTREYYGMKVNLYTMPMFLVEVYYSAYLNKIERIEVVTDTKKLSKHLESIEIGDLLK